MSGILKVHGDYKATYDFLNNAKKINIENILNKYGRIGVLELTSNTPKDSGKTASSWSYKIEKTRQHYKLIFKNSAVTAEGTPIAILIQYGHGTKNGGYVVGKDYINPPMKKVFDTISDEIRKAVNR